MTLVKWNPLRTAASWRPVTSLADELLTMQREIDHMFDNFRGDDAIDKLGMKREAFIQINQLSAYTFFDRALARFYISLSSVNFPGGKKLRRQGSVKAPHIQ